MLRYILSEQLYNLHEERTKYMETKQNETNNVQKSRKRNRMLILLGIIFMLICGVGGYLSYTKSQKAGGGTSLGSYENKTMEEIQAELDQQVLDSMMTISLDVTPTLSSDGKQLAVHVENTKDNKFAQAIVVKQNGKMIGSYEGLKPGEKLDYVEVKDCKAGAATIYIQRIEEGADTPSGNPSAFEVEIVKE